MRNAEAALNVLDALPTGPFGPTDRLVHGDLHDRNLLLTTGGIALLNMDSLGIGDPVEDVGNLVSHFVLRALQAGRPAETCRVQARTFIEHYARLMDPPPFEGLGAVSARTLFRLACIYRFRRKWHHLCPALLNESLSWARGEALS